MHQRNLLPCYALIIPFIIVAPVKAAPQGGNVVSGAASIALDGTDPSRTIINQTSQNTAIDWNSFNIANGETVSFVQPNVNSIALNRDFSGSPSQIFGNMDANGNVFILNTAGVLLGAGANINVGGLLVSDLMVSDDDAQNFETIANTQNWSLPFSDQDLNAGGIEILGTIETRGLNGINLMGQYIYIEGIVRSFENTAVDPGGPIHAMAGGSTVLITDPGGLYGIEITSPITRLLPGHEKLFEVPLESTSARVLAFNHDLVIDVMYEAGLPVHIGPENQQYPGISYPNGALQTFQLSPPPARGSVIENSTAVAIPSPPEQEIIDNLDNTISDSLVEDPVETDSNLLADNDTPTSGSLDNILQNCQPKDRNDKDCIKQNAIKRYLGKLLIGGSLPD